MNRSEPHLSKPNHFFQQVERAVLDLRRGLPVVIRGADRQTCLAVPVEGVTPEDFAMMRTRASGMPHLVLNQHRLAHLGLDHPLGAALTLTEGDTLEAVVRWAADPLAVWPAGRQAADPTAGEQAALALVHRALLVPAALCMVPADAFLPQVEARVAQAQWLAVPEEDVSLHCAAAPLVQRVSEAQVPLADAPQSRFVIFREFGVMREHVAILIGDPAQWMQPVPVRAHSSCLTGDLFGSLRCDCGSQLRRSVAAIHARGGGILLYLSQEGRATGLANKMRAYQTQDEGLDTVDADRALGFDADERDYTVAREMLAQLGVTSIDLLTNNPAKLAGLDHLPIHVAHCSRLFGQVTNENRRYLTAKAVRTGHWLQDLLAQSATSEADASTPK